jgi:hypothetical protein
MLHPLLTLAAVVCCAWLVVKDRHWWYPEGKERSQKPAPLLPTADDVLRNLLDVKSVRGTYRLPEGENYGMIALLWFENGKLRERLAQWQMSGLDEGTRVVSYEIAWARGVDGKSRLVGAISASDDGYMSKQEQPEGMFSKLDGEMFIHSPPFEEIRGYRVLAHMVSEKARPGKPERGGAFSAERALANRETVAVLIAKTFATRQQQDEWTVRIERGDP